MAMQRTWEDARTEGRTAAHAKDVLTVPDSHIKRERLTECILRGFWLPCTLIGHSCLVPQYRDGPRLA